MLTPEQKDEYQCIEKDVTKRDKYLNWIPLLEKSSSLILLMTVVIFFLLGIVLLSQIGGIIASAGLLYFIFVIMLNDWLQKKAEEVSPSPDKLTLFHTYAILDNIENYFDEKMADSKKEKMKYKNNIIKNILALVSIIKKNWYIGDFKLGKVTLGDTVSEFKKHLSDKIVPNTVEPSDSFLKNAETVFYNFSHFLNRPTPKDLEWVNKIMKNIPSGTIQERKSLWTNLHEQPLSVKMVYILGTLMLIVPLAIYFSGLKYFNLTISEAFVTSAPIAGAFLVAFLVEINIVLRSREKK